MSLWGTQVLPLWLLEDLLHLQASSDVARGIHTQGPQWVMVETLNGGAETKGRLLSLHPAPF